MSRDDAYVLDMIRFAREVIELSSGVTRDDYVSNLATRRSIERSLELIGEAARRVSGPFRENHGEIPWRDIIGQRSVLAHDYGDVNDDRVWETAMEKVPDLLRALECLLPPEEQP